MGYGTKLVIGRASMESDELEKDMKHPFEDGSGHPYKRDDHNQLIKTGRREHYFSVFAILDLCKLGYEDDPLNRLQRESHAKAKTMKKERFYYWYGDGDGNNPIVDDPYGEGFWPVPIRDVLAALKASHPPGTYRRTDWAIVLLEAMVNDPEKLEVLFYGH